MRTLDYIRLYSVYKNVIEQKTSKNIYTKAQFKVVIKFNSILSAGNLGE